MINSPKAVANVEERFKALKESPIDSLKSELQNSVEKTKAHLLDLIDSISGEPSSPGYFQIKCREASDRLGDDLIRIIHKHYK